MPRCRGRTKSGTQCQRTVDPGETHCYQHQPKTAAPSAPAKKGRGKRRSVLTAAAATAATVAAVTIGVDKLKKRRKSSRKKRLFGKKRRS